MPFTTEAVLAATSIFAGVLSTVSLFLTLKQMRTYKFRLQYAAIESLHALDHQITQALLRYPELRRFFFSNQECPEDHEHYDRVWLIADLMCQQIDNICSQGHLLVLGLEPVSGWRFWALYVVRKSPIVRAFFVKNSAWYSEQVRDWLIDEGALS